MATAATSPPTPGAKGPRMCKAVVDLGGDMMRDALFHQITPRTILIEVQSSPLLKKKPLTTQQMSTLGNAVNIGDYRECDITLMYAVLRNCTKTNKALCPTKGWGKTPVQPADVHLGDDVERIRLIRNEVYGHVATTDMLDADFNKYMVELQDISNRMDRLHAQLLTTPTHRYHTYSQRLYDIQNCCMDPDTEAKYVKEIKRMAEEEKQMAEKVQELSGDLEEIKLTQEIQQLQIEEFEEKLEERVTNPQLQTLIENTKCQLENHKKELYISQRRVEDVALRKLSKDHVILSGVAGRGKTSLAKQLMYRMQEEHGYTPIKVSVPDDWKLGIHAKQKTLVFIDDFLGSSNFIKGELDVWQKHFDEMFNYVKSGNLRIVIGIRSHVLEECFHALKKYKLFADENFLDLSCKEFELDQSEKEELLKEYCVKYGVKACEGGDSISQSVNMEQRRLMKNAFDSIVKSKPLIGFPQACYVFFSDPNIFKLGIDYFVHADKELQVEIRKLRKRDTLKYLLLTYVLLENRKIDIAALNREKLQSICDGLQIKTPQDVYLQDEMDEMEHTYFKHVAHSQYEFRHETYLEAVLLSFANAYPETFLKWSDEMIILEFARSSGYEPTSGEVCICLPPAYTETLVKKFIDMHNDNKMFSFVKGQFLNLIPSMDTVNDPSFAIGLIQELLHRVNILYFSRPFFEPACENGRHCFVECALKVTELQEESVSLYRNKLRSTPERSDKPAEKLLLLDISLHIGLVKALEKGHNKTTQAILSSPFFGINKVFDMPGQVEFNCQGRRIGKTPILYSAFIGCKKSVEFLLDYPGVNIALKDSTYTSLLHYCITAGWPDIAHRIVRIRPELLQCRNLLNATPLQFAFFFARVRILEMLLDMNNITKEIFTDISFIKLSLKGLIYCSTEHSESTLSKHLFGCEIFVKGKPLSTEEDFVKLFNMVLAYNKNRFPNVALDEYENYSIHYCVMNNLTKVLQFFLTHFPSVVHCRNKTELPTCLHTAVFLGRPDMVRVLMLAGVHLQEGDMDLRTTLSLGEKESARAIKTDVYPPFKRAIRYECYYLMRKCNAFEGVPIRFGEPEQYKEIEQML